MSLLCSTLAWQRNHKINNKKKQDEKENVENSKIEETPLIFYCTRTHKQLSQVVSELKTTIYGKKELNMTILSSREHSCINENVKKQSKNNKEMSEACHELIRNPRNTDETCKYYRKIEKIATHTNLKKYKIEGAFDIEEYVSLGKKCKSCPFFASKQLSETADLILCPYNYIIDPVIRLSMEMNIKNSIIIIDEGHNIEDVCRSSMSLTLTEKQLLNCLVDIKGLIEIYNENNVIKSIYESIQGFLYSMGHWLKSFDDKCIKISFETDRYVIKGKEGVETLLEKAGINIQIVAMLDESLEKLRVFKENEIADNASNNVNDLYVPELSNSTKNLIQSCIVVLKNFLLEDNCNDYVISLSKERIIEKQIFDRSYRRKTNINQQNNNMETQLTCTFICLNPSLAFRLLEKDTYSILLASGTLSPMNSFGPELGVEFKVIYEANFMNTNNQAYVAGLCVGPNNTPMKLTFQYYNMFEIQDKIGKIIYDVCKTVSQGVLCFLPSFNILEILKKRWEKIDLWAKLNEIKHVFVESRKCSHQEYDKMMLEYSDCSFGKYDNVMKKGSLMFAVCRGRSSEGIDFSDNMARAVITIGIPFPNIKTADISAKMAYNDNRKKYGNELYLDGREWYNIQAFRAINQAIGRCIRHKDDWGAIILLDARFDKSVNRNTAISKLSKWVRDKLYSFDNYSFFLNQLENFVQIKEKESNKTIINSNLNSVAMNTLPKLELISQNLEDLNIVKINDLEISNIQNKNENNQDMEKTRKRKIEERSSSLSPIIMSSSGVFQTFQSNNIVCGNKKIENVKNEFLFQVLKLFIFNI